MKLLGLATQMYTIGHLFAKMLEGLAELGWLSGIPSWQHENSKLEFDCVLEVRS